MKYEVQTLTVCDGWVNCWLDDDDRPITYNSEEQAMDDLNEFFEDQLEAIRCGDMSEAYDRTGFRIVPILRS